MGTFLLCWYALGWSLVGCFAIVEETVTAFDVFFAILLAPYIYALFALRRSAALLTWMEKTVLWRNL